MKNKAVLRRSSLKAIGAACTLVLLSALLGCDRATETAGAGSSPKGRRVSVEVARIQYSYDGYWGLFDIASSAKALSPNGLVVAEARVTSPQKSGPISSLDVEEIIYRGAGSHEIVATGSIRFDVRGRVISYQSTSGLPAPIFDHWQLGGP